MRRRMLDIDANGFQQRHCVREELVWHVFYLVLLAGATIVDGQSTVVAIALSQVVRPQVNHRFNQIAHDDPLVTHDVGHLQDVDWWILNAAPHIGPMRHVHAIRKRRRIRLFNDVLVKLVWFADSYGDERVSYAQQRAATRHQHRVPFNLYHGPFISPCSGKGITKAPAGAQAMATLKKPRHVGVTVLSGHLLWRAAPSVPDAHESTRFHKHLTDREMASLRRQVQGSLTIKRQHIQHGCTVLIHQGFRYLEHTTLRSHVEQPLSSCEVHCRSHRHDNIESCSCHSFVCVLKEKLRDGVLILRHHR
mmetsp:Transcript_61595/g.163856  ORF Transcript_61595/g.163856 Transcript_61595/m.163856 type:complete len:306 (+) Transcript_61595:489-1406(+)